ncbi:MAG: ATP-binding protein, partial [Eubacterium sp.]|nr:ATP-binding protein [Eubacterium sp.]
MLGGSFWIALLRNTISTGLMLTFFLMLDRPKLSMKKTIGCYLAFGLTLITGYSIWYVYANDSFVQYAAFSTLFVIGIFCMLMSGEVIYLSLYKMALAFYVFSLCTFCGVDEVSYTQLTLPTI